MAIKSIENDQARSWLIFSAIFALLLVSFSAVLRSTYAISDDYYFLGHQLREKDWFSQWFVIISLQGRPLGGLLLYLVTKPLQHIGDFVYLRLLAIFSATCLAFCFNHALCRAGWTRLQSFFLALCMITLPPFQVYVSWAVSTLYFWPPLASYLSIFLIDKIWTSNPEKNKRILLWICAVLAQLAALATYQPCAMTFWLFAAISLSSYDLDLEKKKKKRLISYGLVFGAATCVEIWIFEAAKIIYKYAAILPERSHFTNHIWSKLAWFINDPLLDALNFHRLQSSPKIAALVFCFCMVGLSLYFQGTWRQKITQLAIAVLFIPLSYLPNLAIAEDFGSYRTQAALTSLLLFYGFLACVGFARSLQPQYANFFVSAVTWTAAIMGLLAAHFTIATFFVIPQTLELELMRSQLRGDFGIKRISSPLILSREQTLAPYARHDEFGLPSTAQPWVPDELFFLLRKEMKEEKK